MSRWPALLLLCVLIGCGETSRTKTSSSKVRPSESGAKSTIASPKPVVLNRGRDVQEGFRGGIHPVLHGRIKLKVKATLSRIGTGMGFARGYFPQKFRQPFDAFSVATNNKSYEQCDFSAFLPKKFDQVGQMWSVDLKRVSTFLKQLHPSVSIRLTAPGRRAGPNGGFAILRAISPTHYDVLLRVHAEFVPAPGIYLTPAYFEGRLLVNRKSGAVDYFHLSLPSDPGLNVTLTAILPAEALIDIIHVAQMELQGGDRSLLEKIQWPDAVGLTETRRKLKSVFYKFIDIHWVPPQSAIATARNRKKPILAIVLWGDLDDQSC